jgi:hypothetical protein
MPRPIPAVLLLLASPSLAAVLAVDPGRSVQGAPAQAIAGDRMGGRHSSAGVVFIGRVLLPDGEPAGRAVVVSSAGGECVTAADGSFELEVEVPLEAKSVQVTAVAAAHAGAGKLVASTRVSVLAAPLGTTSVGSLVPASTDSCQPTWLPTFTKEPGTGFVHALTVFDDGTGDALYAAGGLSSAGGVPANNIAKWNGTSWSALGSGLGGAPLEGLPDVMALAVFDDGGGDALYAGGYFTTAGGVAANCIAKWNGTSWSALEGGVSGGLSLPFISALAVFDDGSGEALYASGAFTAAGGVAADFIARWDGTGWSALGSGIPGGAYALTVFDDGSGDALYAGGEFWSAGGAPASHVAKWDGATWSTLGSGTSGTVHALTVFDDGTGNALYAGGAFSSAGSVAANHIAKWDGTSWSALGTGASGPWIGVGALTVFDDGGGKALYAGGDFSSAGAVPASGIAKWDGASWSALGSGVGGEVHALVTFDGGSRSALCAGGNFSTAGGGAAQGIAAWNGTTWSGLGGRVSFDARVLTVFDDGTGEALYAGGSFLNAGGVTASVVKWDGTSWSALGGAMSGGSTAPAVRTLAVFDDGSGEALYAGGDFTAAGGVAASCVARWNGTGWSALGAGMGGGVLPPTVMALTVFDDGGGEALYATGFFATAGGAAAKNIAKWDGAGWSALGAGLDGGFSTLVGALAVFDDGGGEALYASGSFTTAGGGAAGNIAKWDGTNWSPLGAGLSGFGFLTTVHAMTVFDDGSGKALYAGGTFRLAGGVPAINIARWDGTSWAALGTGVGGTSGVRALKVFDDGSGDELFVGGFFMGAGGVAANHIAKWNGATWTPLGSGMNFGVLALEGFDDGGGPALYAAGWFTVSPAGDSYLAKWGCPAISSVLGCAGNPATLSALATSAPLGAPLPLLITGSAATSGVGLVYLGAPGFDGSGCGLTLPGLGELLLASTPAPVENASGVLASGTCALAPGVPSIPALRGFTVHLQGAAVNLVTTAFIEPTNALAVTLGP